MLKQRIPAFGFAPWRNAWNIPLCCRISLVHVCTVFHFQKAWVSWICPVFTKSASILLITVVILFRASDQVILSGKSTDESFEHFEDTTLVALVLDLVIKHVNL